MENPQYINSPLNNSVSKQTFSFSKSQRFKTDISKDNYRFYNLPSMRSHRASGIGYGKKQPINDKSFSPPPGTYESKSLFTPNATKGNSFGLGREQIVFNSPLGQVKRAKKTVGPNHYNVKLKVFSRKGGIIGKKLPNQFDQLKKKQVPGPGTYDFRGIDMNKSGSYFLSSVRNNISPRYYHTSKQKYCLSSSRDSKLGPGQYNTSGQVGRSVLSKFRNSVNSSFSRTKRPGPEDKTKKNVPGNHYKSFSEFGMSI